MNIKSWWFKVLSAFARNVKEAPGLEELPESAKSKEPHASNPSAHEAAHTWKTHGGAHG